MLGHFTWADYIKAVLTILAAYYLLTIVVFYRNDIIAILTGKKKLGKDKDAPTFEQLEAEVAALHKILEKAGTGSNKVKILSLLAERLKGYPGMKIKAHKVAINNYIIKHAQQLCGVGFTDEELNVEWNRLPR